MSKELIVSVNGREKKIAIIEDERVTEFYIERGEENQGIVGNIYKGRVMRVLPGMQSAFVDIGLERDAFLYVSDFFDEEEEFERIVIDKTKKGDAATAQKAAADHIEQSRVEREHRIEAAQERVEPLHHAEPLGSPIDLEAHDTGDETAASAEQEAAPGESQRESESGRRRRRGRRRGKGEVEPSIGEARRAPAEQIDTPFAIGGADFERVVDEDAAENGAMFKDARIQERLFDQIHAVEFDMETVPSVEVGSLLSSAPQIDASFERVDDGEAEPAPRGVSSVPPPVAAHLESFVDDISVEAVAVPSFERVSDEEQLASDALEPADRKAGQRGKKGPAKAEKKPKAKPAEKAGAKKSSAKKPASGKASGRKVAGVASDAAVTTAESNEDVQAYEDAEASVNSGDSLAEFATRRGGRRRRRTNKPQDGAESNGSAQEAELVAEVEEVPPPPPPPAVIPAPAQPSPIARPRPERSRRGAPDNRGQRGGSRREREQPAITDLLREGQEILVQIAKEPIAKKGARITSHIALPGRFLVYMPTVEHVGVSRKIESDSERLRLRKLIQIIRAEEEVPSGGFIVRTAGVGIKEQDLREDARYLVRTWLDIRKSAEKAKAPSLAHADLDLVQRILRDQLSDDFAAIRVDSEEEYQLIVEFINRIQPRMVKRVKLYTRETPILEAYGVQVEIDKAIKPRVWLRSGGYLVINQTEALVAIDVNTGKFVGRGGTRLEDTITRTNLEAVDEIVRQIRLRDLGGIIVLDLIDMEDRRNRNRVMQALQEALQFDKSPTKVLSFNDFGLVIMTRKRVKQSLERTLCAPCSYCQGAGLIKSPQTICYEILEEARRLSKGKGEDGIKQSTLRLNPEVARALRSNERDVLTEIEDYLGAVDITSDPSIHQEQFDFAFI
jgi:ribonuclease G